MSDIKLILFGKEYPMKMTRGVKDITSGTLIARCVIESNDDNLAAEFDLQARPVGEKVLEFEPKFIEAVQSDYKAELDAIKAKTEKARAEANAAKVVDATAEVVNKN